ncbi:MAG TPA: hypothetical protein PKD64_17805 [Pirellulaceae bacterium]|nr:hypothetical protein [Pirellulaceae bacterium]HMO94044.1 hypothetical protein [Pirellulaceae bacterium]HMP70914.1 hypothetical protein [Pirellulaceae bacterium]
MNCQEFENRIQELLDQRVDLLADDQIKLHANQCDACRSALAVYAEIFEADGSLSDSYPIYDLPAVPASTGKPSMTKYLAGVLTICTALLLVVLASLPNHDGVAEPMPDHGTSTTAYQPAMVAEPVFSLSGSHFQFALGSRTSPTEPNNAEYLKPAISAPATRTAKRNKLQEFLHFMDAFGDNIPLDALNNYYNYVPWSPGIQNWIPTVGYAMSVLRLSFDLDGNQDPDKATKEGQ